MIAWQAASPDTTYQGPVGITAISAGLNHVVSLKNDGTVEVWIPPFSKDYYQNSIIPPGLNSVVAVAAGNNHTVALKSDGTIIGWGLNAGSRARNMPKNLGGVVAIAAGKYQTLALIDGGTVVGWGIGEPFDEAATPPSGLTGVVAIAAGDFSVALKNNGTLVGWGQSLNGHGRLVPAGIRDVVAISARGSRGIALKKNGTVEGFVWGDTDDLTPVPDDLTNVTAISAGLGIAVVAKSDGTVANWGVTNALGSSLVSPSLTGVSAVSGMWFSGVALVGPSLSMHRLVPGEGAKVDPAAGVETPIIPVIDAEVLKALPEIKGGLVADGVTPLIFKASRLKPNTKYTLRLHTVDDEGKVIGAAPNMCRLWAWNGGGGWNSGGKVTTGSGATDAYFYLEGLRPDGLGLVDKLDVNLLARISIDTTSGGEGNESADKRFAIRKPPIVLIHGYNTTGEWGSPFLSELYKTHPEEFVRTIQYGVIGKDTDGNTWASLPTLADVLSDTLKHELESNRDDPASAWYDWALTRYDVVAHSQGGVLTRMLCSKNANGRVPAFRNPANFNKGRFNRVITIGSPHNGSRLVRYMFGILSTNNFTDLVTKEIPSRSRIVGLIKHVVPNLLFQTCFPDWTGLNALGGTIQSKFDPFGPQLVDINREGGPWTPDSNSKFHFIVTGVDDGGSNVAALTIPAYLSLGLSPLNGSYQTVLPKGSDGVVDSLSQAAGLSVGDLQTSVVNSPRTAHAAPTSLFGALDNDVDSAVIGEKVRIALDVADPSAFGPFPSLRPLAQSAKEEIDSAAGAVPVIVDKLIASLSESAGTFRQSNSFAAIAASYRFRFTPLSEHPFGGEVKWSAEVVGADGVSVTGVTVTPDPSDPNLATVHVEDQVEGDVVLYASYLSSSGSLIFGMPILVVSRPLGVPQIGIAMMPNAITVKQGQVIFPEIFATYEGGVTKREFVPPDTVIDAVSSDESVLAVNTNGMEITAIAPGAATLTVNYQGYTAQVSVVVHGPGTVGFSAPAYTVNEASGSAHITVQRTGGIAAGVSVYYETGDGSANDGTDYTATSGVVTFAEGEMSRSFTIPIVNDSLFETDEVLHLTLSHPSGGADMNLTTSLLTIHSEDPFVSANGTYNGLVRVGSGEYVHNSTGALKLILTPNDRFTGKLLLGGKNYSIKGSFDQNGQATVTVLRKGLNALTVSLQINDGTDVITGTVSDGTSNVMSLTADRSVFNNRTNPTPQAGKYTALLPASPENGGAAFPQGTGYATITVSPAGLAVIKGVLGDGTKLSLSVQVSKEGLLPVYCVLYQGGGFIAGELNFEDNLGASDASGLLQWFKPPLPKDKIYASGFKSSTAMIVSRYAPPAKNAFPLDSLAATAGEASLTFSGAGFSNPQTYNITLLSTTNITPKALSVVTTSGLFKGSIVPAGASKATSFTGILFQKASKAEGFFLNSNQSGKVELVPMP